VRQVIWAGPARGDLRKIEQWLAQNRTPAFELRTLQAIHKRCAFLLDTPRGAPAVKGEKRKLLILGTPYLLIYRILDDGVEVLRVFHDSQDWQSIL
jgi:toxin ParE1/3/4